MIAYQVNTADVTKTINEAISLFRNISTLYQQGLENAGEKAADLVKQRAKQGVSSEGEQLFTRSKSPIGAYGQRHGRARLAKGLQVAKVDLTFTGAMLRDFGVKTVRPTFVEVGFSSEAEAQKMEELEALYGTDILTVSDDEEEQAIATLADTIIDGLDKLFA